MAAPGMTFSCHMGMANSWSQPTVDCDLTTNMIKGNNNMDKIANLSQSLPTSFAVCFSNDTNIPFLHNTFQYHDVPGHPTTKDGAYIAFMGNDTKHPEIIHLNAAFFEQVSQFRSLVQAQMLEQLGDPNNAVFTGPRQGRPTHTTEISSRQAIMMQLEWNTTALLGGRTHEPS